MLSMFLTDLRQETQHDFWKILANCGQAQNRWPPATPGMIASTLLETYRRRHT